MNIRAGNDYLDAPFQHGVVPALFWRIGEDFFLEEISSSLGFEVWILTVTTQDKFLLGKKEYPKG